MRGTRLPNPTLTITLTLAVGLLACGRKGDPIPRIRMAPQACAAIWSAPQVLEVTLPKQDTGGHKLAGLHSVRAYFLAAADCPDAQEILTRGEVLLERARPDLPGPGGVVQLDLRSRVQTRGWVVVVAVRVGGVAGLPGAPLPFPG